MRNVDVWELNNVERTSRGVRTKKVMKRKFSLTLGLKRCWWALNDYFGLETTGDKLFYWGILAFCILITVTVAIPAQIQLNNLK